jgi:hypothetical protein
MVSEITLNNWEEFEEKVNEEQNWQETRERDDACLGVSNILFRGHNRAEWGLTTTLERFLNKTKSEYSTIS